jgi:hypothetical protein
MLMSIAANTGREENDVEMELNQLLSENNLQKRAFMAGGKAISVYWPSSIIPFIEENPIITSLFGSSITKPSIDYQTSSSNRKKHGCKHNAEVLIRTERL